MPHIVTVGYFHLCFEPTWKVDSFLIGCTVKHFMEAIVKPVKWAYCHKPCRLGYILLCLDFISYLKMLKMPFTLTESNRFVLSLTTILFAIIGLIASAYLSPCKHSKPYRTPSPLVPYTRHWQRRPTCMQRNWLANTRATNGSHFSKPNNAFVLWLDFQEFCIRLKIKNNRSWPLWCLVALPLLIGNFCGSAAVKHIGWKACSFWF